MTSSHASRGTHTAFIGGGNMARCLIGGLLRSGTGADRVCVSEPDADLRAALARDFGVRVHAANADAARDAAVLVLAVKPQVAKDVCAGLRATAQACKPLVISIAAGIRIAQIDAWLGNGLAVVRCMPNTPALIGAGASALYANPRVSAAQRALAADMLGATGVALWLDDEAHMDTVTAISGSGPAYFFLLAEALEDAAVAQGLPRAAARALAAQTCHGAGAMLRAENADPADLRHRVTSLGGTTQAALESFERDGFKAMVRRAVAAATRRGAELSTQLDD